jgi:hypothetical protein
MKYFIIILFFFTACTTDTVINYKVPAGKHRSTNLIRVLKKDVLRYQFTTNANWVWDKPVKNGWSKVTGIAWNSNHKNSVRVVYTRLSDTLGVLGYYYYINGISPQQNPAQKGILDTLIIGKSYMGRLGWENGFYFIELGDKHHSIKVDKPKGVKQLQNLYIGGTYVIAHPWTTTVTIR